MKLLLAGLALIAIAACPALASPAANSAPEYTLKCDSPPAADFLFEIAKARYDRAVAAIPFRAPVMVLRLQPVDRVEQLLCPSAFHVEQKFYAGLSDLAYRKALKSRSTPVAGEESHTPPYAGSIPASATNFPAHSAG